MGWGCLAGAKSLFRCLSAGLGAGKTSPSSGGELSSAGLLRSRFNFGISAGNLQGAAAGALEAEQEHHELAAKARKSISPESFMRPWIFSSQLCWH